MDSIFPGRVIYSVAVGIGTRIWVYLYEHFSLDQGNSSPLALSPCHRALSQHADRLPFGLSRARKCAPGAALMHPHRSLAFVPHNQNKAHLNRLPVPPQMQIVWKSGPRRRLFCSPDPLMLGGMTHRGRYSHISCSSWSYYKADCNCSLSN